jgi:protein-disulfide isomerase
VLEGNLKLAEALQISGTPAFIIDQTLIPGAMGYAALTQAVNQVRENGCQVC